MGREHLHRWFCKHGRVVFANLMIVMLPNLVYAQPSGAGKKKAADSKEAQTPSFIDFENAENDDARRHFDRGKALFAEEKYEEARGEYAEAWKLRRAADIACNLGNVELMLGKARDAAEHLLYCSKHFPISGTPEQRKKLDARFAEARAKVGMIRVVTALGGVEIVVDGRSVGRSPLEEGVFVEPGAHTVKGKLSGYKSAQQDVEAKAGEDVEVSMSLEREVVIVKVPEKSEPMALWPALVAGGVGVVGIGAGVGLMLASNSRYDDSVALREKLTAQDGTTACLELANKADCDAMSSAEASARTFRTLSIVGYVAGGIGMAVGGVLGYLHFRGDSAPAAADLGSVRIQGSVFPEGGGGVWMMGQF